MASHSPHLAWVVNAYLITFGGLLLLAGRLGDLIGRKTLFMTGLALFTAASALCGLAQSQEMLVGARFLQGIGGATTSAVILGMIVTMFPEPRDQAKAIGIYSFVAAAGASIGLLLGGVLTQAMSWHWIFFVNLPIGAVHRFGGGAGRRAGRGNRPAKGRRRPRGRPDHRGADARRLHDRQARGRRRLGRAVDARAGGRLDSRCWPGSSPARRPRALLWSRCASSATRNVSGANAIQALFVAGIFGMFFLGSLYLERVLGYDPLEIGLAFLPVALAIGILSVGFSERLVMRFGAKPVPPGWPAADHRRVWSCSRSHPSTRATSGTCWRRCSCSASGRASRSRR